MGRRKVKMELQINEKSRIVSFKKRKACLIKKLQELTTLCEVKACMIMYGPHGTGVEPEIWPQNLDETRQIIEFYKAKKAFSGCKKFDLSDYFSTRKTEIEKEVKKIREKNYPSPVEMLDQMSGFELREFSELLKKKAEFVKSRIEHLRESSNSQSTLIDFGNSGDFDDSRLWPVIFVDDEFGIKDGSTLTSSNCYNSWLPSEYQQPPPVLPCMAAAPPPTGWVNDDVDHSPGDILNYYIPWA